jgi:hypothetical protein
LNCVDWLRIDFHRKIDEHVLGFGEIGLWAMWDLKSEWWFKDDNCYEMLVEVIVDWAM